MIFCQGFGWKRNLLLKHREVVKKLLINLSAIGICGAVLPIQAEAASLYKKKDPDWGRQHYWHYHPNYHWRYRHYHRHHRDPPWHYNRYYRHPYWYYVYAGRPAIGF